MPKYVKHRWSAVETASRRVPFGYEKRGDDTCNYYPIPPILDALEYAKYLYLTGTSSREAVEWLQAECGLKMSHAGLIKRIALDNERIKKNPPQKKDAIYYEQGATELPKIQEEVEGARTYTTFKDKIQAAKTKPEKDLLRKEESALKLKKAANAAEARLKKARGEANANGQKQPKTKTNANADGGQGYRGWPSKQERGVPAGNETNYDEKETRSSKESQQVRSETVREEGIGNDKQEKTSGEKLPLDNEDVLFRPNEGPQEDFLSAWEDEVFYGGARGGGKSFALIMDPLPHTTNRSFKGLIVRRTVPELKDLIEKTKQFYKKFDKQARYHVQDKVWRFGSGATLEFGYAETVDDAERYRGQSYTWIGIDELPQYPDEGVYNLLKSSLRSADPKLPTYLRATGNPGNIGSRWVKEKFIDRAPKNTTFYDEVSFIDPRTKEKRISKISMRYIPATVWDNPYLTYDDSYISSLASLPELQRKQMLEGDWDVVEAGAFPEFDRNLHVIEPFRIPSTWPRVRAADWGFASPFSCLWIAFDYDNRAYVYREYYGQGVLAKDWAEVVAEKEIANDEYISYAVIDGSTDAKRGSSDTSIFEIINKKLQEYECKKFLPADRSPGSRKQGKAIVHSYLTPKEFGMTDKTGEPIKEPSLYVFDNCVNLIRTLPMLVADDKNPEVVKKASGVEDHSYDALQYGLRAKTKVQRRRKPSLSGATVRKPVLDATFGY